MDENFDWEKFHRQCEKRRNKDIDKYRVVQIDDFNRDSVSDTWVSSHDTKEEADAEANGLISSLPDESSVYYHVYAPGEPLYIFEP